MDGHFIDVGDQKYIIVDTAISFDLRSSSAKYRYCNINLIKLVFIFIKNDSHYNLWPHKIYT